MKKVLTIFKYFSYFLGFILLLTFFIWFAIWLMVPVYSFPESTKFSGNKWYNPYEDLDNKRYYKANFHAHSKLPLNILNGKKNTAEEVYKAYYDMAYTFATLSNYQTISKYSYFGFPEIPAQEYGISILKTHLLLIGSYKRFFFDQPIYQDVHTKQWRINRTKPYNEIVTIAHPRFNYGFYVEDFAKLAGYDLIEVLSVFGLSLKHWDTALSNGRPAMVIGNDDTHNVFENKDIGRNITMLPIDKDASSKVYDYLRSGKYYGLRTDWNIRNKDRLFKKEYIEEQPTPLSIKIVEDTLSIRFSSEVEEIRFITDNGSSLASFKNTDNASVTIPATSSYVRIEATTYGNSNIYFNPIMRSEDGSQPVMQKVHEDRILTFLKQTGFFILFLIILIYLGKRYKRRQLSKKEGA